MEDIKQHAREILHYFIRNPRAADSLEGIVRWRLLDEVVHRKVEETRRALDLLVKQGFLLETTAPGRAEIFSLNSEKLGEAKKFGSGAPSQRKKRSYGRKPR